MCNFSATWCTCQISLPTRPDAAIFKKKKRVCNFTATWRAAIWKKKKKQEMCNFSATRGTSQTRPEDTISKKKIIICAISLQPGALAQFLRQPGLRRNHFEKKRNCAISLRPCAISLPPFAAKKFHCQCWRPPAAQGGSKIAQLLRLPLKLHNCTRRREFAQFARFGNKISDSAR